MLSATRPLGNTRIITIDSLNWMFGQRKNPKTVKYESKCHNCGCDVKIEISKTSGGYGFLGGVLYETDADDYYAICSVCYKKQSKLDPFE